MLVEQHRLKVLENTVLRKMFGSKKDEVTGEWIKLYNVEYDGGEIKEEEMGGAFSIHGTEEIFTQSFNLKAEGQQL
jgi:hypothetical protein